MAFSEESIADRYSSFFLVSAQKLNATDCPTAPRQLCISSIANDLKLFQEILHVLWKHGRSPTFSAKSELFARCEVLMLLET